MMYPRLKLIHKLLKKDGVFFCSIDDYEHGNLRPILDEIFGSMNFLNNVIWQRAFSPINTKKRFSPNHDFIIAYAKNKNLVELKLPRNDNADDRYSNPDNDPRGIWTSSDLTVGPVIESKLYTIVTPNGNRFIPPLGRCWVVTENRYFEMLKENRIWFGENGSNMPRSKRFLDDVKDGITPMTVWTYDEVGHTQDAKKEIKELFPNSKLPFETPKPTSLMEKILSLKNDPNSIVLDSFAGTASTGHAVLNLNKKDGGNRKFILVELEDYAEEITAERIKKVIKGYDFIGNKRTELASYSINITNLKKADKIIELYNTYNEDEKYSEVTIESKYGNIIITGTEKINGKIDGIKGSFDFYELGKSLFVGDNSEFLNEEVEIEKIREYIWYSETRSPYKQASNKKDWQYLLGRKEDTAIYFIYEKESVTTIDYDSLSNIMTKAGQYILYADNCLLPKNFMLKNNITFKKIPRDVTRF